MDAANVVAFASGLVRSPLFLEGDEIALGFGELFLELQHASLLGGEGGEEVARGGRLRHLWRRHRGAIPRLRS